MLRTIVPNTPNHGPDMSRCPGPPAPRSTSHLPFPVAPATFFQQKSATTKDPAVQFLAGDGDSSSYHGDFDPSPSFDSVKTLVDFNDNIFRLFGLTEQHGDKFQ